MYYICTIETDGVFCTGLYGQIGLYTEVVFKIHAYYLLEWVIVAIELT